MNNQNTIKDSTGEAASANVQVAHETGLPIAFVGTLSKSLF